MSGTPANSRSTAVRADLQALRGVAIVLVVLYHCKLSWFSGGYVGVDVFFVLSGYLISSQLRQFSESGTRLPEFWARRARRLAPAYGLTLLVTMWITYVYLSPLEQKELAESYRYAAVYVSNFWFAHQELDYLASSTDLDPVLHTWSLAVEEQFYLVWPWIFVPVVGLGRRLQRVAVAPVLVAAALVLSLAYSVYATATGDPLAFYSPATRIWEFAAGAMLIWIRPSRAAVAGHGYRYGIGYLLGAGALLTSAVAFDGGVAFPGYAALVPAGATLLMMYCGGVLPERLWQGYAMRALQKLGDYSYSWYLLHWPAIVLGTSILQTQSAAAHISLAGGSLVVAIGMYHALENPIRHAVALRRLSPWWSIAMMGVLVIACLGAAQGLYHRSTAELALPQYKALRAVRTDNPVIYSNNCHADRRTDKPDLNCVYGDRQGHKLAVLWGDSHAAQWMPALDVAMRAEGWRLMVMTKSSCHFGDFRLRQAKGGLYQACDRWRDHVLSYIEAHKPDLVIVASAARTLRNPLHQISEADWVKSMEHSLKRMARSSTFTLVLQDMPEPPMDVPTCLARQAWRGHMSDICSFKYEGSVDAAVAQAVQNAATGIDRMAVVDLSSLICLSGVCRVQIDAAPVFRDDQHLAAEWTERNAAALWAHMRRSVN